LHAVSLESIISSTLFVPPINYQKGIAK
jgi:hypothetical protein